jgi:hypothetical protein
MTREHMHKKNICLLGPVEYLPVRPSDYNGAHLVGVGLGEFGELADKTRGQDQRTQPRGTPRQST